MGNLRTASLQFYWVNGKCYQTKKEEHVRMGEVFSGLKLKLPYQMTNSSMSLFRLPFFFFFRLGSLYFGL